MGCDGGTIPKRDELVRKKKKQEKKDKNAELAFRWRHCAITQESLTKPIVTCELGRLYNKESVLEFLLDRSKFEGAAQFDHLQGMKDIKVLNLTDNPEKRSKDAEKGDAYTDPGVSEYICPVVGLEMSGSFKFCCIWSCGCVMSERALKLVKTDTCHKCGKMFKDEDVIVLNGTDQEVDDLKKKMEVRRALAKTAKKSKKADKHKLGDNATEGASSSKQMCNDDAASSSSDHHNPSEQPAQKTAISSKLKSSSGKTGTQESKLCKRSSEKSGKPKLPGSSLTSIQSNPNASQTFKSLFTTSEEAKNQKQAHWVTYNPLYF